MRDGKYGGGLDALDPTLSWTGAQSTDDIDISYGIESSIRPTSDFASLPKSIWGRMATSVSGWGVSARADLEAPSFRSADVQVDAANEDFDLAVKLTAKTSAKDSFDISTVEVSKGITNANGARITVTPRFPLDKSGARDVVVTYAKDQTDLTFTASANHQEITISQQIDANNRIAPTIDNNGDISVEWERRLSDSASLTANLKPNDTLNVEWNDAAWTANVNMPIDGTTVQGVNVGIRRDVEF